MAEYLDLSEVDLATVLRRYSAHKGWFVRHAKKLNSLQSMVHKEYVREFVSDFEKELRDAERQVSCMQQLTDWLAQAQYNKLEDYQTEIAENEQVVDTFFENITKIKRKRASNVPAADPAPAGSRTVVKPMTDLKPELLQTDASTTDVTQWKRQFTSYYGASNMAEAKISEQHAYMEACLHRDLAKYVSRRLTNTTAVLGDNSCMTIIDGYFRSKYPVLLRRQQFFDLVQKPGQDERNFAEELRATAEEADMANFTLNDALCLKLFNGVSDKRLREKLGEVDQPDIDGFMRIINSHMHAKASIPTAGVSMQTRAQPQQKKKSEEGKQQSQRKPISDRERARRTALRGKCYRCGSGEHRGRACSVQMDTLCNKCGEKGHIPRACQPAPAAARAAADADHLPLEYKPDDQLSYSNAVDSAATYSRPTPQMLL
jgi:hypothetical protein